MNLYLKQKVFSWGDKFRVYDENENDLFFVKGEVFTLGKKLHVYDPSDRELVFIRQKFWSFHQRYFIEKEGKQIAEVVKKITLLKPVYEVKGPDWTVKGNFLEHNYNVTKDEDTVATVSKKWFSWGDTYEISVSDNYDALTVLSVVLIIDAVLASEEAAVVLSNN